MQDIFATYATDEAKEEQGVWHPEGSGRILVARDGNRKYARALTAAVEKNQQLLDTKDEAAEKLSDEIMAEVMAKTILLGVEDLGIKGQPVENTVDGRKQLLAIKDFRLKVQRLSKNFDSYRVKQEDEEAKN